MATAWLAVPSITVFPAVMVPPIMYRRASRMLGLTGVSMSYGRFCWASWYTRSTYVGSWTRSRSCLVAGSGCIVIMFGFWNSPCWVKYLMALVNRSPLNGCPSPRSYCAYFGW